MITSRQISWSAWSAWLTGTKPLAEIEPLSKRIRHSLLRQALLSELLISLCDGLTPAMELQMIECQHLERKLLFLLENRGRMNINPNTGEKIE